MANGNRRTLADCDQRMAEMRTEIDDLREQRNYWRNKAERYKEQVDSLETANASVEKELYRLQGWRDRVREQEHGSPEDSNPDYLVTL